MERFPKVGLVDFAPGLVLASQVRAILGESVQVEVVTLEGEPEATVALYILVLHLNGAAPAAAFVRSLRASSPRTPIILAADPSALGYLGEVLEAGASDFAVGPLRADEFVAQIQRWLQPLEENDRLIRRLKERLGLRRIIGQSSALLAELAKLARFARYDSAVLIHGETGTGKELCARAIHYLSPRADRGFVAINSGAIPGELIENELFGHVAGAYTGARSGQLGLISEADGGTLFLDEIDSLPLTAQVKLLRFLQEKEYRPLGAGKAVRAEVRIVAAANSRIEERVLSGQFRHDLFYRLNVLPLRLPPLRARRDDIPLLVAHFVEKHGPRLGLANARFSAPALAKLREYDWPGNIRELENVVERGLVLADGLEVDPEHVDVPVASSTTVPGTASFRESKARVVANFEKNYLTEVQLRSGGNISQAARVSRQNRRALLRLVRKHKLVIEVGALANGARSVKIVSASDNSVRGGEAGARDRAS